MSRHFALIPAAGSGARMGSAVPKQYLPLLGKPLLHHTLAALCDHPAIDGVFLVIAPQDDYWDAQPVTLPGLRVLRCGGATRADSVKNGLTALVGEVAADDWILVHDAARPCLGAAEIDRLLAEVGDDLVGGLLAVPVADTLKRATHEGRVEHTEPREELWRAQTPQMFRHGLLLAALSRASESPTDEAQAIEWLGYAPRLVQGDNRNLKVTWPEDLSVAAMLLAARAGEGVQS